MDVTSLLNSNPAAAEQRKRADSGSSKGPSRSRTPWDAGGYSLPINTATNGSKSPQKQSQSEYRRDDVPISTPPLSPKHRFSDSRSSLSSFTSSLLSTATHSRFSSTSTLNSNSHAHHKSFSTDIISPELRSISQTLEYAIQPLVIDSCQTNQTRQVPSLSPTGSPLQQLAIVAETHLSGQKSESSSGNNDAMQTDSTEAADSITIPALHNRPGSPSDAILIKRTSIPSLRVNTEDLSGYRQQTYLSAPLHHFQPPQIQNKTHKRTVSEPNFRPTKTSSLLPSTTPNTFHHQYNHSSIPGHFLMEQASGFERKSPAKLSVNTSVSPMQNNSLTTNDSLIKSSLMSHNSLNNSPLKNSIMSDTYPNRSNQVGDSDMTISSSRSIMNPTQLGPTAEPTPPSSQHPDHASPTSPPTYGTPNTPPLIAPEVNSEAITCMFVPNCDTGSQMRKAISHIFGRNKMCTRQIPQHVWVHFCRKHYQRSRYRNPKEYAKTQCDLVQKQIRLIDEWFDANRRSPGVDGLRWSLAVRKREQKRIDELSRKESNKRKRSIANLGDEDEEAEEYGLGREPNTAVPKWLQLKCGKDYSTRDILGIFNILHHEIINQEHTSTFPDLEILPDLAPETKEPRSPRGYTKRASVPAAHRRSQSLGVVAPSHSPAWGAVELPMHDSPSQKRRRPSGPEEFIGQDSFYPRPRVARPIESMRRVQNLAYRPMYTHPEEYAELRDTNSRDCYPNSPSGFQVPLPAPTPVRNTGYIASQLENSGDVRRPMHSRSQSDFAAFHGPPGYPRSPSGYLPSNSEVGSAYHNMGQPPRPEYGYQPSNSRHSMADIRPFQPGHSRHQSTPMMHPSSVSPGPVYHQSPRMYAPSPQRNTLPPIPRIAETGKAQSLCSERR